MFRKHQCTIKHDKHYAEFVHLELQIAAYMKLLSKSFVLIMLCILSASNINGQYIVKKVTNASVNTAQDGFYYSLPQTLFKVVITYEKIEKIRGPLADYTLNYLGTNNYIESNSSSYNLINVDLMTETGPDPDQSYYIQFPAERDKDESPVTFTLSDMGTIVGFNHDKVDGGQVKEETIDQTFILFESDTKFDMHPDYNRLKQQDTITRRITIDTVSIDQFIFKTTWVDKSDEDKANEAALQISRIREGRFNLLTGYQEVAYGESMRYMDRQLEKLEKQYLELFLGKEVKTIESQTVYFVPEKGEDSDVLLNLDDGTQVTIKLVPLNLSSNLPSNPLEKVNHLYYRIPDQAIVEIDHNDILYLRKKVTVNQLGVIAAAPLNRTRTSFDVKTGGLKTIIRE